jgi:hypothetical protein
MEENTMEILNGYYYRLQKKKSNICKRHISNIIALVLTVSFLLTISVGIHGQSMKEIEKLALQCNKGIAYSCVKLSEIAKNNNDSGIRNAAVYKITDQNILTDIAKNATDSLVRKAAIGKVSDETLLVDIVINSWYQWGGGTALAKITDQATLADIAEKGVDSRTRKAAVEKITDQSLLNNIAKNSNEEEICLAAIEKITDQTVLALIARSYVSSDIRISAIDKISNQELLIDIAANEKDYKIRNRIIDKITDENILLDIAKRRFAVISSKLEGMDIPGFNISQNYFAIKMNNSIDKFCPASVYTDIEWISYSDGVGNIRQMQINQGKNCIWCNGAKHTWIGINENIRNTIPIIFSAKDDPLIFRVKDNGEYQYIKGKGYIFLPDSSIVQLPLNFATWEGSVINNGVKFFITFYTNQDLKQIAGAKVIFGFKEGDFTMEPIKTIINAKDDTFTFGTDQHVLIDTKCSFSSGQQVNVTMKYDKLKNAFDCKFNGSAQLKCGENVVKFDGVTMVANRK